MEEEKIIFKLPPFKVEAVSKTRNFGQIEGWHLRYCRVAEALAMLDNEDGSLALIGVVDTGAKFDHPDLQQNLIAISFDATADGNEMDENGHGTHCVGNIGATDNGIGTKGVLPKVKVLSSKGLDRTGSASSLEVANAVKFCREMNCDVLSMSLGAPYNSVYIEKEMKACEAAGIVVVAAAGNQGVTDYGIDYPGALKTVIAVAAVDDNGQVTDFSSRGNVDVAAPGYYIMSTYLGDQPKSLSGTSMACPIVAAAAGMCISFLKRKAIAYTPAMIRKMIKAGTNDAGIVGIDAEYGVGIIDFVKVADQLIALLPEVDLPRVGLEDEAPVIVVPLPPTEPIDDLLPIPEEEDIPLPSPITPLPSPPPIVEIPKPLPTPVDSGQLNKYVGYGLVLFTLGVIVWQMIFGG